MGLSAAVAAELRAEMGRHSVSQRQLALRMRRDNVWLSRRIGKSAPVHMTLEDMAEIADALGVDAERVMVAALCACRDSNPKPSDPVFVVNHGLTLVRIPVGVPGPRTPRPQRPPVRHLSAVAS